MIIHKSTMEEVNKLLNLPALGNEQDWDIELADPSRIDEFIQSVDQPLSPATRIAILTLILASYNELHEAGKDSHLAVWGKIIMLLNKSDNQMAGLLDYWAAWTENNTAQQFSITPLIRDYCDKRQT